MLAIFVIRWRNVQGSNEASKGAKRPRSESSTLSRGKVAKRPASLVSEPG